MSSMMDLITKNRSNPVTKEEQEAVRELISRIRVKVMEAVPFFGHLLLKLKPVATRRIPLAGVTPSRELLINPDWAVNTSAAELSGTLVHEVLHCALLFWDRQQGRNVIAMGPSGDVMSLWNVAHDYVVNLVIHDMVAGPNGSSTAKGNIMSPKDWSPKGLFDESYRDWSAEEVYDDLLSKFKPPPKGKGGGEGGGKLFHPDVDGTKADVQAEGEGEGEGGGQGEGEGEGKGAGQKSDGNFWQHALVEAAMIQEQSRNRGVLPGSVKKILESIIDPRVSWVEVLARWVGENGRKADFTWRRPSRRSESIGEFLPTMKKNGVDDVCILWDSSGSMGDRHKEIIPEVLGIVQDLGLSLRVIVCDAAIHSDQSGVEQAEDIDYGGGGGSDFRPAFERLDEEQYEGVLVVFTDGFIAVPEQKPEHLKAVLWCLWPSERGDQDPTGGRWGEVIVVDEDGMVSKAKKAEAA
jgi:predicted metal-dependent peptidase